MMYYFNQYILNIFIFLSVLPLVFSTLCFECRSYYDPNCGDPFDNSTIPLTDCKFDTRPHVEVLSSVCRKVRQKVNDTWIVTRSCAFVGDVLPSNGEDIHCVTSTGADNNLTEYCTCNSNGCNSV